MLKWRRIIYTYSFSILTLRIIKFKGRICLISIFIKFNEENLTKLAELWSKACKVKPSDLILVEMFLFCFGSDVFFNIVG